MSPTPLPEPSKPYKLMIQSFACLDTEHLFATEKSRRWSGLVRVALRKLIQLNQAGKLSDMAVPPGNRLEALKGNLSGFHSIRINDQWRICFRWRNGNAMDVEIVDYH